MLLSAICYIFALNFSFQCSIVVIVVGFQIFALVPRHWACALIHPQFGHNCCLGSQNSYICACLFGLQFNAQSMFKQRSFRLISQLRFVYQVDRIILYLMRFGMGFHSHSHSHCQGHLAIELRFSMHSRAAESHKKLCRGNQLIMTSTSKLLHYPTISTKFVYVDFLLRFEKRSRCNRYSKKYYKHPVRRRCYNKVFTNP